VHYDNSDDDVDDDDDDDDSGQVILQMMRSDIVQYNSDVVSYVEVDTLEPNEMMFTVLYGAFVCRPASVSLTGN